MARFVIDVDVETPAILVGSVWLSLEEVKQLVKDLSGIMEKRNWK